MSLSTLIHSVQSHHLRKRGIVPAWPGLLEEFSMKPTGCNLFSNMEATDATKVGSGRSLGKVLFGIVL